jgi:hypothetical protein
MLAVGDGGGSGGRGRRLGTAALHGPVRRGGGAPGRVAVPGDRLRHPGGGG